MVNQELIDIIIKIRYTRAGYLPNHPYHLISNAEMCDAFMTDNGTGYFFDTYPLVSTELTGQYNLLVDALQYHISQLKADTSNTYQMPQWVYSYMLGAVISSTSDTYDIHDLIELLHISNTDDTFTEEVEQKCYQISVSWLKRIPNSNILHRPPTMFGEPHVIKALRLANVQI